MPDTRFAGEALVAATENARAPFTLSFTATNTDTPLGGTTAEAVWITTPSITFRAGRAYRVTVKGLLQLSAAATEAQVRVRKGVLGGLLIYDSWRIPSPGASNYGIELSSIFTNATASSITTTVVGSVARASGTGTVLMAASVTSPAYLHFEDLGPASDFTGAVALT
ncbi:hypothetical protein [Streptomyces sp. AM 2-1-1]|uniref:hypothetical protein n=1 Tax=Streptomyces sp. AM 2-1-1 TaxID=3028709 RepID=UPI0023B9C7BB|nr:hypothetical protein [Streptomyces sp. AM 2-1-1]WEH40805.1 hypothetical protein PZB77_15545 [Streptomyces sp. AM 2-1-1]